MIRASVPNPDKDLRPGMFVTAKALGAERPSAIVVPQLAVQQGAKGNFVVVANAENLAELRPVVVGSYFNDKDIVIEQGLKTGDRVIVDGLVRVVPNSPVKPNPAGVGAAPAAAVPATAAAAK
jgi:membrane fusion protein (multidrug efflux system)